MDLRIGEKIPDSLSDGTDLLGEVGAIHDDMDLDSYNDLFGNDEVVLTETDRYKGVGIFGAPGGGKSVCIANMIDQDLIMAMTALVLIDPSGQLCREMYSLAQDYGSDVTYLSKECPSIGLNLMLAPYSKEQVAELVIEYLNHLTLTTSADLSQTTRMRNVTYEGVITCIEKGRPRLDALLDWLKLLPNSKNPHAVEGVIARLESILSTPAVHRILCSEDAIDFQEFVEQKKVLIVDTFGFGKLPSIAVGSALNFLIRENFMAVRREEYHPLALYIDEAHKFVSDDTFSDLLKMARKFKIATTLGTQEFASISNKTIFKQILLANLGTFIAINPGMSDSREIANEFRDMDASDLKFIDNFHATIKTPSFEGVVKMPPPPFTSDIPLPVYEVVTHPMWFTEEA